MLSYPKVVICPLGPTKFGSLRVRPVSVSAVVIQIFVSCLYHHQTEVLSATGPPLALSLISVFVTRAVLAIVHKAAVAADLQGEIIPLLYGFDIFYKGITFRFVFKHEIKVAVLSLRKRARHVDRDGRGGGYGLVRDHRCALRIKKADAARSELETRGIDATLPERGRRSKIFQSYFGLLLRGERRVKGFQRDISSRLSTSPKYPTETEKSPLSATLSEV